MLLLRGADTGAKNYEDQTPVTMADDKDLKEVLKELKKGVKKKVKGPSAPEKSREVAYSPDLRKKVTNSGGLDRLRPELLVVRFNPDSPVPASPGLLKRRRVTEGTEDGDESRPRKRRRTGDGGEDDGSPFQMKKRIKWVERDSTGAPIDPQFSEEEGEASEGASFVDGDGSVEPFEDSDGHHGTEITEISDERNGDGAIDLFGNDNATLAEDLVSKERLEWHNTAGSQVSSAH